MDFPQLQNLVKREPETYKEEFLSQYRHFLARLEVLRISGCQVLSDHRDVKEFAALVDFLSHTTPLFKEHVPEFSSNLINLLQTKAAELDATVRRALTQGLMLLRNKNAILSMSILPLFFELFRLHDKPLRKLVFSFIVSDVRNLNQKTQNPQANRQLQNFLVAMLKDTEEHAAKKALDVLIELYRKNIWSDARTVNFISEAILSPHRKLLVSACNFFLQQDDEAPPPDSDEEENPQINLDPGVVSKLKHTGSVKIGKKKSRKLARAIAAVKRKRKATVSGPSFSAIQLLHDPQGLAEKAFAIFKRTTFGFEVKLLLMRLISRLISCHKLLVLNFYSAVQKYMKPHHKQITQILSFAAQAVHELVPPDAIEPLIRGLMNDFVSDRCSDEVMAIGINTIREICDRQPLAITEESLRDLAAYKSHRNKGVVMAARSLIGVFRTRNPVLLKKKDRGKVAATTDVHVANFGELTIASGIDNVELIDKDPTMEVLSQEDFDKLRAMQDETDINKKMGTTLKRPREEVSETVGEDDIRGHIKRAKQDKEARMASVMAGREGRDRFGQRSRKTGGSTNKEKQKHKPFLMDLKSSKVRRKTKRTLAEVGKSKRKSKEKRARHF